MEIVLEIIHWLEKCQSIAFDQPILRESIKQYILLIKKLTHQLSDKIMEENVKYSIIKNYEAANIIFKTLPKIELNLATLFLYDLAASLRKTIEEDQNLFNDYEITVDKDLSQAWSGLRIHHKTWNGIIIKLEGQSRISRKKAIYGISANKNKWKRNDFNVVFADKSNFFSDFQRNQVWPYFKTILNFNKLVERKKLLDPNQRKEILNHTAEKLHELVKICQLRLSKITKVPGR